MPTVSDMMTTTFQTQPLSQLSSSVGAGGAGVSSTEFLVVTTNGLPLSLLPGHFVETFGRTGTVPPLPTTPFVGELSDFARTVDALGPQLLVRSDLAGAVVFGSGQVLGVLPRGLLTRSGGGLYTTRSWELPGWPTISTPTFVCPLGGYEEEVLYYDPSNPPRCPDHPTVLLVRKV